MSDDLTPPAESTPGDMARSATLAAIAAIPGAGGALSEMVDVIWVDPYRMRITAFAVDVIAEIQGHDLRIQDLEDDELFQTVAARAVQAATQTHEEEKLEALRNAVVNVALGVEGDEVWTHTPRLGG